MSKWRDYFDSEMSELWTQSKVSHRLFRDFPVYNWEENLISSTILYYIANCHKTCKLLWLLSRVFKNLTQTEFCVNGRLCMEEIKERKGIKPYQHAWVNSVTSHKTHLLMKHVVLAQTWFYNHNSFNLFIFVHHSTNNASVKAIGLHNLNGNHDSSP